MNISFELDPRIIYVHTVLEQTCDHFCILTGSLTSLIMDTWKCPKFENLFEDIKNIVHKPRMYFFNLLRRKRVNNESCSA